MARHLVVPIDLEALCGTGKVLPDNAGVMPSLTSYHQLPYGDQANGGDENFQETPFISETVLQQPFNSHLTTVAPGVHLHWAMPDALMRGEQKDDLLTFPELPDRWLLLRLSFTAAGAVGPSRALVIDSRYLAEESRQAVHGNGDSTAILWQPPGDPTAQKQHFMYLGRSGDVDWWQQELKYPERNLRMLDKLNAASFGRTELSAYYPNTRNVFGVLDDLKDLGGGQTPTATQRLAYVVIGWHTDPANDPIAGKPQADTLDKLKWSVNASGDLDRAIYCGMVHSVVFDPNAQPSPPGKLSAAMGNTTTEALSALLTSAVSNAAPDLEFQLDLLLSGLLDQYGQQGGPRQVTRQLHKQRFVAARGGHLWYVKRKPPKDAKAEDQGIDGGDLSDTLPADQKVLLAVLNAQQETLDRLKTTLEDLRWQVFSDWYKYLVAKWGDSQSGNVPSFDQIQALIQNQSIANLKKTAADVATAEQAVVTAQSALQTKLDAALELAEKPASRYFRPRDPVLLLSGDDVTPTFRYGGDNLSSDDGTLPCRGSDALVSGLSVPAGFVSGLPGLSLGAADGGALWPQGGEAAVPPELLDAAKALALEAALLSPDWAGATLAAKAGGAAAPAAITAALANRDDLYAGTLPSPVGRKAWRAPWLPILIHWELTYRPVEQTLEPQMIVSRLSDAHDALDADEVDVALQLKSGDATQPNTYRGITFLTPHAGLAFQQKIKDYVKDHKDSPLAALSDSVLAMPLLSQALSGLQDRFLMRHQATQLGVADPFYGADEGGGNGGGDNVAAALAEPASPTLQFIGTVQTHVQRNPPQLTMAPAGPGLGALAVDALAPLPQDPFNPLVAGSLALSRITIVDAFGQMKVYDPAPTLVAAKPLAAANLPADAPVLLPPRLAQPASLRVQWIAAGTDTIERGEKPVTSPIFAWIVPNYLDGSLHLYTAGGGAIGALIEIDGALTLFPNPADPTKFGKKPEEILAGTDPHLHAFATAMLAKKPDYLRTLLNTFNDTETTVQPQRHARNAQLPVLVGEPLALARAAAWMELMGARAIDESWKAVADDIRRKDGKRTTGGYENVQLPFMLGNVLDPDDGLFGFFIEGDHTYDTFYTVGVDAGATGFQRRKLDTLTVTAAGEKLFLTLLIDPRAEIHVTSGLMPADTMEIPALMYRDALSALEVTFLTAPVLTTTAGGQPLSIPLPLPGIVPGPWQWARVAGQPRQAVALDVTTPKSDPAFGSDRVYLQEGWLAVHPPE
jgi:hypothetical protein